MLKDAVEALNLKEKEEEQMKIKEESMKNFHIMENKLLNDVENMVGKLDSIMEIIQDQQQEIGELRLEVNRLRQDTTEQQQRSPNLEQILLNQMSRQVDFLKTVENTVKDKVETTIPKAIHDIVEPLKRQLRVDVGQIDNIVRENFVKLIGGPQVRDSITSAITTAGRPALENSFREAFQGILLPGMEKACQNMFKQVQDTFVRGTRDCKTFKHYV